MNSQVEVWRAQQYAANVYHLSQQKDSRLAPVVRREMLEKGKASYFDRLGLATAQVKSGRNSDTPNLNIAHSRRMVSSQMYEWATLVDSKDKLQNIHDPENEYAKAARSAMGRAMDDVIITAALGNAYTGEAGGTTTTLGTGQKVVSVASSAASNLNVQALRKAKYILDANQVDPSIPRFVVVNASGLENLLTQTETTSSDYNTVRALVMGELDTFLGFKFIMSERCSSNLASSQAFTFSTTTGLYAGGGTAVSTISTAKSLFAFAADGILLGIGKDISGRIDERADKSYDMQVYSSMDLGAVRMEEEKVVEIICSQ